MTKYMRDKGGLKNYGIFQTRIAFLKPQTLIISSFFIGVPNNFLVMSIKTILGESPLRCTVQVLCSVQLHTVQNRCTVYSTGTLYRTGLL